MKMGHFLLNRVYVWFSDKLYSVARWCDGNAIRHRGRAVFEAIPPADPINDVFHEPDPAARIKQVERAAKADERVADALISGYSAGKLIHDNPKPPDPNRVAQAKKAALPCAMDAQYEPVDDMQPWGSKRRCKCGEGIIGG